MKIKSFITAACALTLHLGGISQVMSSSLEDLMGTQGGGDSGSLFTTFVKEEGGAQALTKSFSEFITFLTEDDGKMTTVFVGYAPKEAKEPGARSLMMQGDWPQLVEDILNEIMLTYGPADIKSLPTRLSALNKETLEEGLLKASLPEKAYARTFKTDPSRIEAVKEMAKKKVPLLTKQTDFLENLLLNAKHASVGTASADTSSSTSGSGDLSTVKVDITRTWNAPAGGRLCLSLLSETVEAFQRRNPVHKSSTPTTPTLLDNEHPNSPPKKGQITGGRGGHQGSSKKARGSGSEGSAPLSTTDLLRLLKKQYNGMTFDPAKYTRPPLDISDFGSQIAGWLNNILTFETIKAQPNNSQYTHM